MLMSYQCVSVCMSGCQAGRAGLSICSQVQAAARWGLGWVILREGCMTTPTQSATRRCHVVQSPPTDTHVQECLAVCMFQHTHATVESCPDRSSSSGAVSVGIRTPMTHTCMRACCELCCAVLMGVHGCVGALEHALSYRCIPFNAGV